MIRVRDDDVLMHKGDWEDPYARFVEVHDLIVQYGAMHVPAVLTQDILEFSDAVVFIRKETLAGRMEPQWHGSSHVDYAQVAEDEIVRQIGSGQCRFRSWFEREFTKFYTPWGANAPHIRRACERCNVEMVDCSNTVTCVQVNNGEVQAPVDELFIHWWAGKERLNRALKRLSNEEERD